MPLFRPIISLAEMQDDGVFVPPPDVRAKARVIGENTKTKWYHVATVGETRNEFTLERAYLEGYVADFYARPEPGPVYRGHVDMEGTPTGEEPAAAAWVLALHLDELGKLWALYELTDRLHREIVEGGYRFNSIVGAYELGEDGELVDVAFISIAVTNRPAVVGLTPMAASHRITPTGRRVALGEKTMRTDIEYLKEAMKELGEDAALEKIVEWVTARRALDKIKEGGGEAAPAQAPAAASQKPKAPVRSASETATPPPPPTTPPAETVELAAPPPPAAPEAEAAAKEELYALVSAAAAAAGTDVAGVLAALRDRADDFISWLGAQAGSGTPADTTALTRKLAASDLLIAALTARAESAESERSTLNTTVVTSDADAKRIKATTDVDALVTTGRLLPAQRDSFLRLALSDRENFDAVVAKLPQVVLTQRVAAADGPVGVDPATLDMTPQNDDERRFLEMSRSPETFKRQQLAKMRSGAKPSTPTRTN